jgi:hypothetical protein
MPHALQMEGNRVTYLQDVKYNQQEGSPPNTSNLEAEEPSKGNVSFVGNADSGEMGDSSEDDEDSQVLQSGWGSS